MYRKNRDGWLSLSYKTWMKICVDEKCPAFIIEVTDNDKRELLLDAIETSFRKLYEDIRYIKQFPIVDEEGHTIAYAVKCGTKDYTLTEEAIRLMLARMITAEQIFRITKAQDYKPGNPTKLLARPTGCPWIPQSSF